jgi:D-alanine-D-alanine ligase
MSKISVLVLGGGPDAEREVSLKSAAGIAQGLRDGGTYHVLEKTIDRVTRDELKALPGDVIVPALHGSFGEGGTLQDLMDQDGRPYVGCRGQAARWAMDKMATKLFAARAGIPTSEACILNPADEACPLPLPVVVKPVHDGSSVGLHIVKSPEQWRSARGAVAQDQKAKPGRAYLIERYIAGSELTCPVIDARAFPIINIRPADGVYDYDAKYIRKDTQYIINPELPAGVADTVKEYATTLFQTLGCRHLSRIDFMLDLEGRPWLLEINTFPGFTATSLVPKAANAEGLGMPALCEMLVGLALRDHRARG